MSSAFADLLQQVHRIHDINKANAVLSWDREVNMPASGDSARVEQMTTLRRLSHERVTAERYGELIESAAAELERAGVDPDGDDARLIEALRRDRGLAVKEPEAFVVELSKTSAAAWRVWKQARQADDFASFLPHLERLIELQRERADMQGYAETRYDALLDRYEQGSTTAEVKAIFDAVREATVPLLQAIMERGRPIDDALLHQDFDIEAQQRFSAYIAPFTGFDPARGHIGTATHPFATSFSRDDARITSRWYPDFLNPSVFGTLHECGHAMYEQGTGASLARTPLARGTSSGIHESQSRMIENFVGRSRGFWSAHYPTLQAHFPDALGSVPLEDFHRAINKVQPSLIRVEADELTYNLHIILRFELEQAMLDGDLAARDLPGAWNDRLEALLGVRPTNDREGCLQDVHWSGPSFGYFPTYALGNFYAAQLFATARAQEPAIDPELDRGRTEALVGWLRQNVHQHGRKFPPRELIQRATGRPLGHEDFVRYAREKFTEIYEL